ncbi:MAG: FliH/SctL family protein [Rickettsiales bacterium]
MLISPLTFKEFEPGIAGKEVRKKPFANQKKTEEPEAPPPPPTFSEEELRAAERDAYQRGFLDGTKEGHATAQSEHSEVERILMEGLENFVQSIAPIFEQYKSHCQQLKQDMPPLALSIAKKVAGYALSQPAQSIIESAAKQCTEIMVNEPQVTVTVNSRLSDILSEKLKQLRQREKTTSHISVVADDNIVLNNYHIEWKNGSLERSTEKLWQQIDKAIDNMLAAIANEPVEQLDLLNKKVVQ